MTTKTEPKHPDIRLYNEKELKREVDRQGAVIVKQERLIHRYREAFQTLGVDQQIIDRIEAVDAERGADS